MISRTWNLRLFIVGVLTFGATEMIRPMMFYRALELEASAGYLGVLAAAFAALPLVLAIPIGRRIDQVGVARALVLGPLLLLFTATSLTLVGSLSLLAVAQASLGTAQLVTALAIQTALANRGSAERRDSRMGAYTIVVSVAQLVGPAAGGVLVDLSGSLKIVWLVGAVAVLISTSIGITFVLWPEARRRLVGEQVAEDRRSISARAAVRSIVNQPGIVRVLWISLVVVVSIDLLVAYLPAYGESNGLSVATVGLLLSARAAASLFSRLMMVPIVRLLGRWRALAVGLLLPSLAVLLVVIGPHVPLLMTSMILVGFGLGLGSPITLVSVADKVPIDLRGIALGMRIGINRAGQVIIPAAVGLVAASVGLWAVFGAMSLLLSTGSLVARRPSACV